MFALCQTVNVRELEQFNVVLPFEVFGRIRVFLIILLNPRFESFGICFAFGDNVIRFTSSAMNAVWGVVFCERWLSALSFEVVGCRSCPPLCGRARVNGIRNVPRSWANISKSLLKLPLPANMFEDFQSRRRATASCDNGARSGPHWNLAPV